MAAPTHTRPLSARLRRAPALALSFALLAAALPARADDWAVGGLDVVELFRGKAIAGRSDIATRWHGKLWLFEEERNRSVFEADPRSYAPALNGLCPVALSEGRRVRGNPALAVVISGRLYLPESESARQLLLSRGTHVLGRSDEAPAAVAATRDGSRADADGE